MNKRSTYINLPFKGANDVSVLVKQWAHTIYTERRFENQLDGVDFFVNSQFRELQLTPGFTVTKWGKGTLDSCFHCITGYPLFDIIPWWQKMQTFFERTLGLTPWLPYPCILISKSNLRRHVDKGRPTALNYPIFGEHVTTNYIWYNQGDPDDKYDEQYQYYPGVSVLVDTSKEHGGFVNTGYSANDLRAIFNMGFRDPYDVCLQKITDSYLTGTIQEIL